MRTKHTFVPLVCTLGLLLSCKEQEKKYADSPLITVNSPIKNQVIDDKDSVVVHAVVENKSASPIKSVVVWLINNQKKYVYNKEWPCDCKSEKSMTIEGKFRYDIEKTSDLLLHVDAMLEDGTSLREEVPFRLLDSK